MLGWRTKQKNLKKRGSPVKELQQPGTPEDSRFRDRRPGHLAEIGWDLGSAIGGFALLITSVAVAIVLLSGSSQVRERLGRFVPDEVSRWFSSESRTPAPESKFENLRARVLEKVRGAGSKSATQQAEPSATYFTVGSSQEEVLAIQGRPTASTESVWLYGDSEVYFVGGRVSNWKNSRNSPLRVR